MPWKPHGVQWNPMEFHKVPWNSMELHGIPWGYFTRDITVYYFIRGQYQCLNYRR